MGGGTRNRNVAVSAEAMAMAPSLPPAGSVRRNLSLQAAPTGRLATVTPRPMGGQMGRACNDGHYSAILQVGRTFPG
jgi:hypothetical protein